MSSAVPLREDETILAEDKVLRLVGPLGQHGEVVLTNQRVMFVPTGRLDRLVGASQCAMDVDQMISLEIKGLDRVVVLETKADTLRLSGAGAHRLYERLQSLLAEHTGESGRFEVGERILVQGSLDVFIKAVLSTKGEVVLTDRRLRITCRGGIETLLFKGRDLDVRL